LETRKPWSIAIYLQIARWTGGMRTVAGNSEFRIAAELIKNWHLHLYYVFFTIDILLNWKRWNCHLFQIDQFDAHKIEKFPARKWVAGALSVPRNCISGGAFAEWNIYRSQNGMCQQRNECMSRVTFKLVYFQRRVSCIFDDSNGNVKVQ